MKYIYYFKESNEINLEEFKDDVEKVFENEEWLVIKPKSFEAFCYYGQDQGWSDVDYGRKYNFRENTFININKDDNTKTVLNFDRGDFYTEDDDIIYLKEFLDANNALFNFYGEILECPDIIKENDEYWIVVDDYNYFENFFKLDHKTRDDLIKKILGGDGYEIFNYSPSDFSLDENFKLTEDNFELLKMLLILEKLKNIDDNDYDIEDIKNYDDIVDIIKQYDFDELKSLLKSCICTAHESADADAAWEDVTDEIYNFFNLEMGSAKWQNYKNNKNSYLWIKFKSNADVYPAKFIINKYDDSYDDDIIDYSPPYYGYSGDYKNINDVLNNELSERIYEYESDNVNWKEIKECIDAWKEMKKENPKLTLEDSEIMNKLQIFVDAKKYNI